MPVNVNTIFTRGGRQLIDFLEFCVLTVNKELVFVYLAREYRLRPTASAATGLFDMFCAEYAPARINVGHLLPPKDRRLERAIELHRVRPLNGKRSEDLAGEFGSVEVPAEVPEEVPEEVPAEVPAKVITPQALSDLCGMPNDLPKDIRLGPQVPLPPRYLFDAIVQSIVNDASQSIAAVEQRYDPTLTPHENLPGGSLQAGQRAFVENVWLPIVRPHLVAAGFWRMATVA